MEVHGFTACLTGRTHLLLMDEGKAQVDLEEETKFCLAESEPQRFIGNRRQPCPSVCLTLTPQAHLIALPHTVEQLGSHLVVDHGHPTLL